MKISMDKSVREEATNTSLLWEVYRQSVVDIMYEELLAEAKPKLRDAAEKAVEALDGSLRARFTTQMDRLVDRLEIVIEASIK